MQLIQFMAWMVMGVSLHLKYNNCLFILYYAQLHSSAPNDGYLVGFNGQDLRPLYTSQSFVYL